MHGTFVAKNLRAGISVEMVAQIIGDSTLSLVAVNLANGAGELNARIHHANDYDSDQDAPSQIEALLSDPQIDPSQNRQAKTEQNQSIAWEDEWLLMRQIGDKYKSEEREEEGDGRDERLNFF